MRMMAVATIGVVLAPLGTHASKYLPEHGSDGLAASLMPHLVAPSVDDPRVRNSMHKLLEVPLDHMTPPSASVRTDQRMFK